MMIDDITFNLYIAFCCCFYDAKKFYRFTKKYLENRHF